mgnify:CR=1 FL=1
MRHPEAATGVRYQVIGAATAASLLLYIDRICIAEIAKLNTFQTDLGLTAALGALVFDWMVPAPARTPEMSS